MVSIVYYNIIYCILCSVFISHYLYTDSKYISIDWIYDNTAVQCMFWKLRKKNSLENSNEK